MGTEEATGKNFYPGHDLAVVPFDPPLYLGLMIAWKRGAYLSQANRTSC